MKVGKLPPGVRLIRGRFYWQPSSRRGRLERKAAGLPASVPLGADPEQMRRKWAAMHNAEALPEAGTVAEILARFEREELDRMRKSGRPRYRPATRRNYARSLRVLMAVFGAREYAANHVDASRGGKLRTMHLQQWVSGAEHGPQANAHLAVLSVAFECARRWGYTEYNPCKGVRRNEEQPRTRDVEPWEIEVLLAASTWNMHLIIRLADCCGMRQADILALHRDNIQARGIVFDQSKTRNRRQVFEWSPELRAIVAEAWAIGPEIRGAVFCTRRGKAYTSGGFQVQFRRTLQVARALALEVGLPPLVDLHFHDIRKKAGNDAEERGEEMHTFLGNTPEVSHKHYRLRGKPVKPNK
jgi:integrase